MLAAAGIDTTDALGPLKLQGRRGLRAPSRPSSRIEEADLAKTMARLDKELDKGERLCALPTMCTR